MKTLLQKVATINTKSMPSTRPLQQVKRAAKVKRKRRKTAAQSMRISVTISPQMGVYLRGLLKLGLYGSSISDVAERLMCESLHSDTKRLRLAALTAK